MFRNLDLETLGEVEINNLKNTIKETINEFFKAKNKRFEKFLKDLEKRFHIRGEGMKRKLHKLASDII